MAVSGMSPGRDIPLPDEPTVAHREHPATPPAATSDQMGQEPFEAAVDERRSHVECHVGALTPLQSLPIAGTAEGAKHVASGQNQRRGLLIAPPGGGYDCGRLRIGANPPRVGGYRSSPAPVSPTLDRAHSPTAPEIATTPR